jgi:hypothetical protein
MRSLLRALDRLAGRSAIDPELPTVDVSFRATRLDCQNATVPSTCHPYSIGWIRPSVTPV